MKHALVLLAALGVGMATPAQAERLDIDHRLYAPLHAAMENPREGTIFYDASQPGRLFDRILVRGTSAEHDWTEALELLVTRRNGKAKTPQDWLAGFQPASESACPATLSNLSADITSLTFALEAPPCPAGAPLTALYRVVLGRKSAYLVSAKVKGAMSATQREQWLALLASAHLSD